MTRDGTRNLVKVLGILSLCFSVFCICGNLWTVFGSMMASSFEPMMEQARGEMQRQINQQIAELERQRDESNDTAEQDPQWSRQHRRHDVEDPLPAEPGGSIQEWCGDLPPFGEVHEGDTAGVLLVELGEWDHRIPGDVAGRHVLGDTLGEDRSDVDGDRGPGRHQVDLALGVGVDGLDDVDVGRSIEIPDEPLLR